MIRARRRRRPATPGEPPPADVMTADGKVPDLGPLADAWEEWLAAAHPEINAVESMFPPFMEDDAAAVLARLCDPRTHREDA